jgi:hypothetical protein
MTNRGTRSANSFCDFLRDFLQQESVSEETIAQAREVSVVAEFDSLHAPPPPPPSPQSPRGSSPEQTCGCAVHSSPGENTDCYRQPGVRGAHWPGSLPLGG